MCGCESCEIAFASRSKRWRASGESGDAGGECLDGDGAIEPAIAREYTSPMPPAPIAATISYGPSRVPAGSGMAATF